MEAGDWRFEAIEVIRGDEAWQRIQSANQFNNPPTAGNEYVAVLVRARYEGEGEEDIDQFDFRITGSRGRADRVAFVIDLDPWLDYTLQAGGDVEGWVTFEVGEAESQLMLIFDRFRVFDDVPVFLALEADAQIAVDRSALPATTDDGRSRAEPAAVGATVVTDTWAITVLEHVRGDDAVAAVAAANQFNDPPPEGFEYVSVLIRAQAVSSMDAFRAFGKFDFRMTGNARVLYDVPALVDPEPPLDVELFPGGVAQGWATFIAAQDETGLMLRFGPLGSIDDTDTRFLALDNAAGVPVADAPLAQPTEVGVDRESPVPFGELATTDQWEARVLEVVRGEDALVAVREAFEFNDAPDAGMEYVQVRVWVRNIGAGAEAMHIGESWFATIGSENVRWNVPLVVDPEPNLDVHLYTGGVWEGWVTLQAAIGEADLLLVFEPLFDFTGEGRRYLALS